MRVLVAGCGWLGTAVGRALVAGGARVVGVRRSAESAERLQESGIEGVALDLTQSEAADGLPLEIDAVVGAVSADDGSVAAYRAAYVEATGTLLAHAERSGARLVWVGSTGVFGQDDGGEVDEESAVCPTTPTAEVLCEAERRVLDGSVRSCIVRMSGLYGPGRFGVVERVRSGRLALGPGDEAWMNWCHREDAVRAVLAALARGTAGTIYHASDGAPARRREVVTWISERLGIVAPRHPDGAPAVGGRRGANRRVAAVVSRRALGLDLAFPSFREGLAEAFDAPGG